MYANTCKVGKVSIAGGIDEVLAGDHLHAGLIHHHNTGDPVPLLDAVGKIGVHVHLCACLIHHPLGNHFIGLGIKGNVAPGFFHHSSTHGNHLLSKPPRNAATIQPKYASIEPPFFPL